MAAWPAATLSGVPSTATDTPAGSAGMAMAAGDSTTFHLGPTFCSVSCALLKSPPSR